MTKPEKRNFARGVRLAAEAPYATAQEFATAARELYTQVLKWVGHGDEMELQIRLRCGNPLHNHSGEES